MTTEATSKSLQGITELTLVMTVRPGLIKALDTHTHLTRVSAVMATLQALRASSREWAMVRPITDSVERVQSLHTFRVVPIGADKLMLAVTFDRPWEPYIRIIWRELGPLLDLLLCNCVGYPLAATSRFDDYARWIRQQQVDTPFFYSASAATATDLLYLRQLEQTQSRLGPTELLGETAPNPAQLAADVAADHPGELAQQGLTALSALYRLREYYQAPEQDAGILHRAARALLKDLTPVAVQSMLRAVPGTRWKDALDWFYQDSALPCAPEAHAALRGDDVQGGILRGYRQVRHGRLLLLALQGPAALDRLLHLLPVSSHDHAQHGQAGLRVNIAFTLNGLRQCGATAAELAALPKEFREGMEARASLLGDVRINHPRRWRLPRRFDAATGQAAHDRVDLSRVHAMLQLRWVEADMAQTGADSDAALQAWVRTLAQAAPAAGIELLAEQALHSHWSGGDIVEHFGFADGISQPTLAHRQRHHWSDQVPLGELLLGHPNARGDLASADHDPGLAGNGSFLVVRKLSQDVPAWEAMKQRATQLGLNAGDTAARLVGRQANGQPLAQCHGGPSRNDFTYQPDPHGVQCPLQSHVRRANPRQPEPGRPASEPGPSQPGVPRIARRGMSYGARWTPDENASANVERGLVFLAYNASIAEQFEVIQRWLAGGNSTGLSSTQADPLLGVPQPGEPRVVRLATTPGSNTPAVALALDADNQCARPFVRLEWGLYLLAPSISVLDDLRRRRAPAATSAPAVDIAPALAQLRALELADPAEALARWKALLEDTAAKLTGHNAALWAQVRREGGAMATPVGVLLGSKDLVAQAFKDEARYSVSGYAARMAGSFGPIHLGQDAGPAYQGQAEVTNQAILAVSEAQAFDDGHRCATDALRQLMGGQSALTFHVKEWVDDTLARLSQAWFDLPDGRFVLSGGWDPATQPVRCPGHFTSPSRYFFSPAPTAQVEAYGRDHGQALLAAVGQFVASHQGPARHAALRGRVSKPLFQATADPARLARNLIGAMMGFLPTTDGTLRSVLYDWIESRQLWALQARWRAALAGLNGQPGKHTAARATLGAALVQTMQTRPVPDLVWRTAKVDHQVGTVAVKAGQKVVLGIVSATQDDLLKGRLSADLVFGGNRQVPGAPTHACPGRQMAMGALLGALTALLEAGELRSTGVPLTLSISP